MIKIPSFLALCAMLTLGGCFGTYAINTNPGDRCYADLNNDFCIVHHTKDESIVAGTSVTAGISGLVTSGMAVVKP